MKGRKKASMQKLHRKTARKLTGVTLEWKWQKCDGDFYLDPVFKECYVFIEHGPLKEDRSVDKIYNLANEIWDFNNV